ncbi:hypothetical protein BEL01nite_84610 [Bradyrhizobium elkanii]|nr:hypothetical protein BEL01nite_84610 [Bradyrhizobium elkanii]
MLRATFQVRGAASHSWQIELASVNLQLKRGDPTPAVGADLVFSGADGDGRMSVLA